MRRLTTILLSLAFAVLFAVPVLAGHDWQIKMSDPSTSDQLRTFNIEYVALSTVETDEITVKLLQNGEEIDSQTTQAGGDSGVFSVTVPVDGSYTYSLSASSSDDNSTLATAEKIVTVATPEGSDTSNISVSEGGTGPAVAEGEVEAAEDQGGQVGDDGASTENKADDNFVKRNQWPLTILALIAILGGGYYWFYYRQDKTLFDRNKD